MGVAMWFKNLRLYQFNRPFSITDSQLAEQLSEYAFVPCGATEMSRAGWIAPVPGGEALAHQAAGNVLLCWQKEEKLLPAAVVRDQLEEQIAEREASEQRSLTRKEKQSLKDALVQQLLPRAFCRRSRTYLYFNQQHQWLVVDSSSASRADECLAHLRKALGSLPVVPFAPRQPVSTVLTRWLLDADWPQDIAAGQEAELRTSEDDGAIIRIRNHELGSEEIQLHLRNHKKVVRLAIDWDDTLSCLLDDELTVRRLRFADVLKEQNEDVGDDQAARFDADFALMAGELNRFIERLRSIFDVASAEEQ